VADEPGHAALEREARERRYGLLAGWGPGKLVVPDPGEPANGRSERTSRIGEGEKSLAKRYGAVCGEAHPDRADLDDAFGLRFITGRLEVDRDEFAFQSIADLAAERAVGRRAGFGGAQRKGTPWHLACGRAVVSA
jgi:hypothetical protein